MLAGKRAVRVGDQILKDLADLLIRKVRDPRIDGVTLTGISLSNDLKHARVYYSVLGDKSEIERSQNGLDSAKGYIKREIGRRLNLRYMPDIIFEHDPTLETGNQIERLFEKIRTEDPEYSDEE
ncbi:MAG: 30S ribosome-binding factor RbfA [Deltaproteobacteria bacterium]|nr:30S ribosome-binding factor RbfA [Deltaproteobacteria bacterium]